MVIYFRRRGALAKHLAGGVDIVLALPDFPFQKRHTAADVSYGASRRDNPAAHHLCML